VSSPIPAPLAPKSSTFTDQVATATSFSDLQRALANLQIRVSKNSPPGANDLQEMQLIYDKTTNKLWIQSNGTGFSVQFS
jgi:hypothetical protein